MPLPCPYLHGEVELTAEREAHICERHPDLLPEFREQLATTLADPDRVRRSARMVDARLFSRWFDGIMGGKHVVVVVVSETVPQRHWVITAYLVKNLAQGGLEWKRS
ncbi:MAG: hypothetical protein ACREDR_45035 [Blastocatellia bacterium]